MGNNIIPSVSIKIPYMRNSFSFRKIPNPDRGRPEATPIGKRHVNHPARSMEKGSDVIPSISVEISNPERLIIDSKKGMPKRPGSK